MTDYVDAMAADGLSSGEMRKVELEGHEFLVSRVGDDYFVTDDRCAHLHGDLSRGTLEGTVVTCPRHGSQYDVRDGRVLRWTDWPDTAASVAALVRHPRPIRAYEVRIENGRVQIGPQMEPPPVIS